ncbi:MAG: glycoside hydrolase family 127 protein [Gemmiger sp.]|nr:glycoside hydrolase family 127 protein [Gemmiger sp.]
MLTNTQKSPNTGLCPLPAGKVQWTDGLWQERVETCATATVPHLETMFASKDISHVVENFKICAGEAEGDFDGTVFGDGDFYKWMEAATYLAAARKDQAMLDKLEAYIQLIGKAQQPDGYLSTKQIIGERNGTASRMGDINDFEVYNFGHLFTAACLYFRVTGRDGFLKIAERTAAYLQTLYTEAERTGKAQTAVCPSHYMGLVELYRTTGKQKYLALAQQAVALRSRVEKGLDDNQDRIPLEEQEAIMGHAVRANYLYAGMADLCAESAQPAYRAVLDKVWRSLVDKKLYITGGCGALYNGASPYGNFFDHQLVHQAYGYEYQLPNITAYNETCAAVGGVYWAYRMFLLKQKAEYFDVLERMLLNTVLAGVSLDGKRFFYENMLRRAKKLDYKLVWPLTRSEYILSYCCPPNLARTVAQSAEYAYLVSEDGVWAGIYGASRAEIALPGGNCFTLVQSTGYPFDGKITFTAENAAKAAPFTLHLRIPAWAEEATLTVNGVPSPRPAAGSYLPVVINNPATAQVVLDLGMKPRLTVANSMVEEDVGQAAVECGPLVYCIESPDADVPALEDLMWDPSASFRLTSYSLAGRTVTALETEMLCLERGNYDRAALYQRLRPRAKTKKTVRLVPYFAWDNRGAEGEMRIWFPVAYGMDF